LNLRETGGLKTGEDQVIIQTKVAGLLAPRYFAACTLMFGCSQGIAFHLSAGAATKVLCYFPAQCESCPLVQRREPIDGDSGEDFVHPVVSP